MINLLQIAINLHGKDDPQNTARVVEELKASLGRLHHGKDLDDIKVTAHEFIQLLMENKELCDLVSPFNIEQPR